MINSITDSTIACYNTSVRDMLTLEQECYKNNFISPDVFKKLVEARDHMNFYKRYLKITYNLSISPSVLPLPKKLNTFTEAAYLSSLKEKYGLTYTRTTINIKNSRNSTNTVSKSKSWYRKILHFI